MPPALYVKNSIEIRWLILLLGGEFQSRIMGEKSGTQYRVWEDASIHYL